MKKRVFKIFGLLLLLALIVIQFIPVSHINPPVDKDKDFLENHALSADARELIVNACYDCHSHESKYPWYSYVAPISIVIEDHIINARKELNFSEWADYSKKKKDHKLEETIEALTEGWMPLKGYVAFHSEADLSVEQTEVLVNEIKRVREELNFED